MARQHSDSVEPTQTKSGRPARYPCINPRFAHLLHGADYNPDQ
jgi:hypothetical protein